MSTSGGSARTSEAPPIPCAVVELEVATSTSSHLKSLCLLFIWAALYSLFYLICPVLNGRGQTNYWAYSLIKKLWWGVFTNTGFIEMAEASIPGIPDDIYLMMYFAGMLTEPSIAIVSWLFGAETNTVVDTLLVAGPLLTTSIGYMYWIMSTKGSNSDVNSDSDCEIRGAGLPFDLFSMIHGEGGVFTGSGEAAGSRDCRDQTNTFLVWQRQLMELQSQTLPSVVPQLETRRVPSIDAVGGVADGIAMMSVVNPVHCGAGAGGDDGDDLDSGVGAAAAHQQSEQPFTVASFFRRHRLLPRFWNEQRTARPWAAVTATRAERPLHYWYTFLFMLGWVVCYFVLMVRALFSPVSVILLCGLSCTKTGLVRSAVLAIGVRILIQPDDRQIDAPDLVRRLCGYLRPPEAGDEAARAADRPGKKRDGQYVRRCGVYAVAVLLHVLPDAV
jgi:hypothetical protein